MVSFRPLAFLFLVALALAAGCGSWRDGLVKQVSFDHKCPQDQIQILRDSGDNMSRTVDVSACGKERRYRDLGGSRMFAWQDVTEAPPGEQKQNDTVK